MQFFSVAYLLPGLAFIAIGALLAYLARSIQQGNLELLAGYDPERVQDKTGLAFWAGNNLQFLGYIQMFSGVLAYAYIHAGATVFGIATVCIALRTALGSRKFYR